jgi:mono/diheme cytochrome c family protein
VNNYRDEIDWQDLKRKPEKLFGYSYIYVLAVLVGIGVLYVSNLNIIGRNAIPPVVTKDSTAFAQDVPFQSPRNIPPIDVLKAGVASSELIGKGRELYKGNCAACHGDNGQGDGVSASMLTPKPRNFHPLDGWKNGSKVSQIYKTLQEGIPGGAMASYNYLPPEDRFALIHYIRTFASSQPQDSPEDLKQLDVTYQLAKGMNTPGQIPIKKAMQIIIKEEAPVAAKIGAISAHQHTSETAGSELFKRVVSDEKKVWATAIHLQSSGGNVESFIRTISADPIHAGFKAGVVRLAQDEWNALYQYLVSTLKQEDKP